MPAFKNNTIRSKEANESSKDIDQQRFDKNRYGICGGNIPIEKVQTMSIYLSNKVKIIKMLEESGLNEQMKVIKYSREEINYDVPELGSPENSSILNRREKVLDYSPGISTADGSPKTCFGQMVIAPS